MLTWTNLYGSGQIDGNKRPLIDLTYAGISSRYIWWKAWTPFSCFTL